MPIRFISLDQTVICGSPAREGRFCRLVATGFRGSCAKPRKIIENEASSWADNSGWSRTKPGLSPSGGQPRLLRMGTGKYGRVQ